MYHDPNYDWIAHYDSIAMRMEAKAKAFAGEKVPHVHLTSGKPLRRPRSIPMVSRLLVRARIIYDKPIGPQQPVRDIINVSSLGFKGEFRTIIREVSDKYNVPVQDIMGPRRQKYLMIPRFEVFYRLKMQCPRISLPQMGRLMGDRDHTTALNAIRRYEQMLANGEVAL